MTELTQNEKMESKTTLTDEQLVAKCEQLVHELAKTEGKSWRLNVPVDFNRDPDMLFIEMGKRLLCYSTALEEISIPSSQSDVFSAHLIAKNALTPKP